MKKALVLIVLVGGAILSACGQPPAGRYENICRELADIPFPVDFVGLEDGLVMGLRCNSR